MVEINLGNTIPLFAHDVAFSTLTKTTKSKEGKVKKEYFTEMIFVDSIRKSAIARIMLPQSVLRDLPKRINEALKKGRVNPKDNDAKEQKSEAKAQGSYLG